MKKKQQQEQEHEQSESPVKKVTIRLPASVVEAIRRRAEANERTFNREVVYELRAYHRGLRRRRAAGAERMGAAPVAAEATRARGSPAGSSARGAAPDLASDLAPN